MAKSNPLNTSFTTRDQVVSQVVASLGSTGQDSALAGPLTTLAQQLQQLQTINQTQSEAMQSNTLALNQSAGVKAENGSSTASTIEHVLEGFWGLGSGLSPLISGLTSLFGGGGSSEPAPLVPFVMPLPIHPTAGISAASPAAFGVDTAEGGLPRPVSATPTSTQVTVQVQAMDSRSFLDHSNDIAMAVRQAMLESSVLNDVIREV